MLFHFKVLFLILMSASVFALFSTAGKIKNIPFSRLSSYRNFSDVKMCNKKEERSQREKLKNNMQRQDVDMKENVGVGEK
jgi:hypothetical protein